MKGTHLGEFEELVLLLVGILYGEAYGVAIRDGLEEQAARPVRISAVHSALHRLEDKGFVISKMGGATARRGGRRKRLFTLTDAGKAVLEERREERSRLWSLMPQWSLKGVMA